MFHVNPAIDPTQPACMLCPCLEGKKLQSPPRHSWLLATCMMQAGSALSAAALRRWQADAGSMLYSIAFRHFGFAGHAAGGACAYSSCAAMLNLRGGPNTHADYITLLCPGR